jgi:hypothetical protein
MAAEVIRLSCQEMAGKVYPQYYCRVMRVSSGESGSSCFESNLKILKRVLYTIAGIFVLHVIKRIVEKHGCFLCKLKLAGGTLMYIFTK